jgi:uroporphyrinogen-III decarboxylase
MFQDPETFHRLMMTLTSATIEYLKMQIHAGAEVVQMGE